MNCFWVQLSSSHVNIILASYYIFYPTGNFNSEAQLSINLSHKTTSRTSQSDFLQSSSVQEEKFRVYVLPMRANISLVYYATRFIIAFYYMVSLRTHNTHSILIKKHFKTFYHILKYSLHVQLHFLIHTNTTDIKRGRHHEEIVKQILWPKPQGILCLQSNHSN